MSRSSLITVAALSSVVLSMMISIVWFITVTGESRFAPAVQAFVSFGGLAGFFFERRVAVRERRHRALLTLKNELRKDIDILDDLQFTPSEETPRPRVYPRLPVSATDAVLTSGALEERSDNELIRRLHNWRDEANGFNRRLDLTEMRVFIRGTTADMLESERALQGYGNYLNEVRDHIRDLHDYLAVYR